MMHCKKATFLMSKREENKLTWLESVQLNTHMGICSFCRRFEKQTRLITCLVKEIRPVHTLSEEAKEKMQAALQAES